MSTYSHRVVVVGGGTAGITVAARLRRAGVADVAVVEPSDTHWTSRCGRSSAAVSPTWRGRTGPRRPSCRRG